MFKVCGIDELDEFIIYSSNNNKVIMLYFGADWCGPCKQLKEKLRNDETQEMMPNLSVCFIDVDDPLNEELVSKYKVSILPTQIFVKLIG